MPERSHEIIKTGVLRLKGYTFADSLKYGFFLIYTKLVWRKARLVRLPVLIRNRNNISYGQGFTCGTGCRINPGSKGRLVIGKDFVMGDYCQIEAMNSIRIGNGVLLASRVYIGDACHGVYKGKGQSSPMIPPSKREIASGKLVIGDNVWIGNGVSILGGGGNREWSNYRCEYGSNKECA